MKPLIFFIVFSMTLTSFGQNKRSMIEFADKLLNAKISSKNNHQKLVKDIKDGTVNDYFQFVHYTNKAVIIKENNYPSEPDKYLELIHKDVSKLLPELSFSDFTFQIKFDSTNSFNDSEFYNFVVSLKCNGKIYRQTSSYHLYTPSKNQYIGNKIDQQEFYKIFNKILADNQSIYRLHVVKSTPNNVVDWTQFGIIALTKEQADMIHNDGYGIGFWTSFESFKNALTSKKIDNAIAAFQKLGLLSHLTDIQINIATEKVKQQDNKNLNDVLLSFPQTIYFFDTEMANLEDPYKEFLNELSIITHGLFKPYNITDNFATPVNKKATVAFSLNEKKYSKDLQIDNDWIDTSFLDLVKQAVSENKLIGQFYELYTNGQEGSLIFLTTEQYQYLRANKLLLFADQWQTSEE